MSQMPQIYGMIDGAVHSSFCDICDICGSLFTSSPSYEHQTVPMCLFDLSYLHAPERHARNQIVVLQTNVALDTACAVELVHLLAVQHHGVVLTHDRDLILVPLAGGFFLGHR